MGWDFYTTKMSKKTFIENLVKENRITNYMVVGNHLWAIEKIKGENSICLYLLKCEKGCWGYKCLTEHEAPFYYDCPVKLLLQLSPLESITDSKYAIAWRNLALLHHMNKGKITLNEFKKLLSIIRINEDEIQIQIEDLKNKIKSEYKEYL